METRETLADYYSLAMIDGGKEKITDEDLEELNRDLDKAREAIMDDFMRSRGLLLI